MELTGLVADAILSAAADAVVATDREGIIRVWNPGAKRIFGYHAGGALGQSLDLIIPERLRARHWEGFRHVIATGESHYGAGDLLSVPGIRDAVVNLVWDPSWDPSKMSDEARLELGML